MLDVDYNFSWDTVQNQAQHNWFHSQEHMLRWSIFITPLQDFFCFNHVLFIKEQCKCFAFFVQLGNWMEQRSFKQESYHIVESKSKFTHTSFEKNQFQNASHKATFQSCFSLNKITKQRLSLVNIVIWFFKQLWLTPNDEFQFQTQVHPNWLQILQGYECTILTFLCCDQLL